MDRNFDRFFAMIIDPNHEGTGVADDPHDPGGLTRYGVSDLADGVADHMIDLDRDGTPDVRVQDLTPEQAKAYYRRWYWRASGCDHLPDGIDVVVGDFAVNSGVHRAVIYLQKIIDAKQDGDAGPGTFAAVDAWVKQHSIDDLIADYNDARMAFYKAAKAKTGEMLFPRFGHSWTQRTDATERIALELALQAATA